MNWVYESRTVGRLGETQLPDIRNYLIREDGFEVEIRRLRDEWVFCFVSASHTFKFGAASEGTAVGNPLIDPCELAVVSGDTLTSLKSLTPEQKHSLYATLLDFLAHIYLVPAMKGRRLTSIELSPMLKDALAGTQI